MRIILIEDDPMIGESICDGLRAERYAVDWVRDGKAAESALADHGYDLILLDLGLPNLDGLDLLEAYRKRGGEAPVLVTTAGGDLEDRMRGLDSGADDCLVKPFDLDEIYARVRALLRRVPFAAAPGVQATPKAGNQQLGAPPQAQPELAPGAATIECRGLRLKPATGEISFKGSPLRLNGREYAVLPALLALPGLSSPGNVWTICWRRRTPRRPEAPTASSSCCATSLATTSSAVSLGQVT